MSVMWQMSRGPDPILSSPSHTAGGPSTSNGAYGGWFAKQSIPTQMYNRYGAVNTRTLNEPKKYHTPSDSDISSVLSAASYNSDGSYDPLGGHVPYPPPGGASGTSTTLPTHVRPPAMTAGGDRTTSDLVAFSKAGAYRPAISLTTSKQAVPNLTADKTLILISPRTGGGAAAALNTTTGTGATLTGGAGDTHNGTISRRSDLGSIGTSLYQSPLLRQVTNIKTSEDSARLAANKMGLQRSNTIHGGGVGSLADRGGRFSDLHSRSTAGVGGGGGTAPNLTGGGTASLGRSNSFVRHQMPKFLTSADSSSTHQTDSGHSSPIRTGAGNNLSWLYGANRTGREEDRISALSTASLTHNGATANGGSSISGGGGGGSSPQTIYRHGSFVTPTVSTMRSDSVRVEPESPINRYSSATLRKREQFDQFTTSTSAVTNGNAQQQQDYSTMTSMPRPNDPSPLTSTRPSPISPPKGILKKRSSRSSAVSDTSTGGGSIISSVGANSVYGTIRHGGGAGVGVGQHYTTPLAHTYRDYSWSAPSSDQLLSVPHTTTASTAAAAGAHGNGAGGELLGVKKPPSSPSKRVTFCV